MERTARLQNFQQFFAFKYRFLRLSLNENLLLLNFLACLFHLVSCIWKWTVTWISAYSIYGNFPASCWFSLFASFKYFSCVSVATTRPLGKEPKWPLIWHSRYTTDCKVIGLSIFFCLLDLQLSSSFHRAVNIFVARRKNYSISCFQIDFYMRSSLLFFFVFSNVSRYSTRMKYCCIWFRFCPPKSMCHVFRKANFLSFCEKFCHAVKK